MCWWRGQRTKLPLFDFVLSGGIEKNKIAKYLQIKICVTKGNADIERENEPTVSRLFRKGLSEI